MKKIYLITLLTTMLFISGCGIINQEYNNSINNKVVSVSDYTIDEFQDAIVVATEKAEASCISIIDNGVLSTSLGSAVVVKRENYNGTIIVEDFEYADHFVYYAVTNYHVIEGQGKNIKAYLKDNLSDVYQETVQIIDYNEKEDLALIKFNSRIYIEVCSVNRSTNLKKGQIVLAIGSPYSLEYYNSVSMGIISHPNRIFLEENSFGGNVTVNYIQHDALINPGNSGGGLFDLNGNLIGINTARIEDDADLIYGISLSIPINDVVNEFGSEYFDNIVN